MEILITMLTVNELQVCKKYPEMLGMLAKDLYEITVLDLIELQKILGFDFPEQVLAELQKRRKS